MDNEIPTTRSFAGCVGVLAGAFFVPFLGLEQQLFQEINLATLLRRHPLDCEMHLTMTFMIQTALLLLLALGWGWKRSVARSVAFTVVVSGCISLFCFAWHSGVEIMLYPGNRFD